MNQYLIKEIKNGVKNNKGCIILDLAFFIPLKLQKAYDIDFALEDSTTKINAGFLVKTDDYKLNHRFSNKKYLTVSKKIGFRTCKCGYPIFVDLDKKEFILRIRLFNEKNESLHLCFPIYVSLTPEKPFATFTFKLNTISGTITIKTMSYKKVDSLYEETYMYYSNTDLPNIPASTIRHLKKPAKSPNIPNTLIYIDIIHLISQEIEQLDSPNY